MTRRRLIFLAFILAGLITVWQLPTVLRAIPSRYVAAYLPQSVQAMAEREHSEILPTVIMEASAMTLLESTKTPKESDITTNQDKSSIVIEATPASTILDKPSVTVKENGGANPGLEPTFSASPTALPTRTPVPLPVSSRLQNFEHHFQTWNNCGPATLVFASSP